MALKDFDNANPRTKDKNWKENIPVAELSKMDEWYAYRIIGGIFSYSQHWIEFTNKEGTIKRYPVDCANWDPQTESNSKKGECPACEAGIKSSTKYMMNVICRQAQKKGDSDPIRALDIPPTLTKQLQDLKKLNMVKNEPRGINHPKFGIDVFLQKQKSKKRGGLEWQAQKGERTPLTDVEMTYNLIDFEEHWMEPDVHKIREDLKRHGFFEDEKSSAKKKRPDEEDDDVVPAKKKRPVAENDDEDVVPVKKKRPSVDEDDEVVPAKKKRPVADEDEDYEAPRRAKKAVVSDDEDEDAVVPTRTPAKKAPVEDDEEEESPPPRKLDKKKKAPAEDFEDDFDDV